jgi:hypothetical protein
MLLLDVAVGMSTADESTEETTLAPLVRTVTPPYVGHEELEMDVIGWSILLGLLVVLLPLLPFLVIVWLITKGLEVIGR